MHFQNARSSTALNYLSLLRVLRGRRDRNALIVLFVFVICGVVLWDNREKSETSTISEPAQRQIHKSLDQAANPFHRQPSDMPTLVHLDLKGSPPKMSYLREFLPHVRQLGATGLLIEYEDTFPYTGRLSVLRSTAFSYSKEEIDELLELAHSLHLDVIPLVQTFGHLEFALKHPEFTALREEPDNDWSVCPLRDGSVELVKEMIDQIMAAHRRSKYIHVGGDEVANMGKCRQCQRFTASHGKVGLYRMHMLVVMRYVAQKWHGVRSLFWDDMVRHWSPSDLKAFAEFGDPMVWCYVEHVERMVPPKSLSMFASVFPKVWLASAFKGAAHRSASWVPVKLHVNNHYSWNRMIHENLPSRNVIGGLVLTGWSRYMHHWELCELLPAAIPSLALCLEVAAAGEQHSIPDARLQAISSGLGFKKSIPIEQHVLFEDEPSGLNFPGHAVYELIFRFAVFRAEFDKARRIFNGKDRSSAFEVLAEKAVRLSEDADLQLNKVFPPPVAQEWIRINISPILKEISSH